jgi:hypothetical protein|tara:strand:+ start:649 stop:975 length:327 start_codon:yes stop_codon:yes gene_type:complete
MINIFVRDVIFENGLSEDGELQYAKAFNIYAQNERGERLVNNASDFTDLEPKGLENAERFAKRVQAHIDAGGKLNLEHWYEVDPCYGSAAYVDQGTEERVREWERANG